MSRKHTHEPLTNQSKMLYYTAPYKDNAVETARNKEKRLKRVSTKKVSKGTD